ncbi:hypothetical protein WME91_29590 [Sorangium sp. So ce269]
MKRWSGAFLYGSLGALAAGAGCFGQAPDEAIATRDEPLCASCGAVTTFDAGKTPSRVVHVDAVAGSDTSGTGLAGSPYRSLAHAMERLESERRGGVSLAGVEVRLAPGQYGADGHATNWRGTAAQPIWIRGASATDRAQIRGPGVGLKLGVAQYVVIENLDVSTTGDGINIDDFDSDPTPGVQRMGQSHHVVMRNLVIHDVGEEGGNDHDNNVDCIKLSGVDQFHVLSSSLSRCGGPYGSATVGSGIDGVGCHDGLVLGNTVSDMNFGVQLKGGSAHVEIRANELVDAGRAANLGGTTEAPYFRPAFAALSPRAEAHDLRLVSNVIRGGEAGFALTGCVGCLVANNTIVSPEKYLFRLLWEADDVGHANIDPPHDNRVVNNIFHFTRPLDEWEDVNVSSHVIDAAREPVSEYARNLYHCAGPSGCSSAPRLPEGYPYAAPTVDGFVGAAPGFDASYRITTSSYVADRGVVVSGVAADRAGYCFDSAPAIGAYEATTCSGGSSTTTTTTAGAGGSGSTSTTGAGGGGGGTGGGGTIGVPTIEQRGFETTAIAPGASAGFDVEGGTDATRPWKKWRCDWGCWVDTASDSVIDGARSATVACDDETFAPQKGLRQQLAVTPGAPYTVTAKVRNGHGAGYVRAIDGLGAAAPAQPGGVSSISGIDTDADITVTLRFHGPPGGVVHIESGVTCDGSTNPALTSDLWAISSP